MWLWSPAAARALAGGHTAVTRVDVLHGGRPVYTLEATGGQVQVEAGRPVRRNLACTLVDPTGRLSRGDVGDLLNPYECEIAPHRGVMVPTVRWQPVSTSTDGFGLQPFGTSGFGGTGSTGMASVTTWSPELAPLGVFGLTARQVSDSPDGLTISLTGQDRAITYQGPMDSALAISGGTPVEEAILRLLSARNPRLSLLAMRSGFTCGPLLFPPDVDVWGEASKLAESVGGQLFHDRLGQCVFSMLGPASGTPVTSYQEGDGRLLSVDRTEDSDTVRNVVVAESADGSIRVVVEDDDPTSPTYARGRYGRRVATLTSQHFSSVAQARQAAAARLEYELGRSETVAFTALVDPGRDVDEVVQVHRPRAGLVRRGLAVASLAIPLGVREEMQVGCRRSVIARDGQEVTAA